MTGTGWLLTSLLVRHAEHAHRLTLPAGPVWTYVATSPIRRPWGFHTDQGWVGWRDYYRMWPL